MTNISSSKAILTIPEEVEQSTEFRQRIATLIQCDSTHIYIDTSFLMWMTKIGSDSRRELETWLKRNCTGRVHIPIWSAHEYLRHDVAGSIAKELSNKAKELQGLAGRSYAYFRPFMDAALDEGDPSVLRTEARRALDAVAKLAEKVGGWTKLYEKNAVEVISFINDLVHQETSIYEQFDSIENIGSGRYGGLVPPGYKDRLKTRRGGQNGSTGESDLSGTNVYGDLIFWQEILFHAQKVGARALVVITNDRKSDWYMGGGDNRGVEPTLRSLKRDWKPVPRPHPMLVTEARVVAKVQQVDLLDSVYLAVVLRDIAESEVRSFAEVAIAPDAGVLAGNDKEVEETIEGFAGVSSQSSGRGGSVTQFAFPDLDGVSNSRGQFRKVLLESRTDVDKVSEGILQRWRAGVEAEPPTSQAIPDDPLSDFDQTKLAKLARELHDRVLEGISGYQDAVVDLVLRLDELPLNTAATLYLGLLSSMYLSRGTNSSRIPPASPIAKLLFNRQSRDYSVNGIRVVSNRLLDNETRPLYLPSTEDPPIDVVLDVEPEGSVPDELRSLTIQGTEVLVLAQAEENLRLSIMFEGSGSINGDRILRKACELFMIPYEQVQPTHKFQQEYNLTEMIGFKRAMDVVIRRGGNDGK